MKALSMNSQYNGWVADAEVKVTWAMKKLKINSTPAMRRLTKRNPGTCSFTVGSFNGKDKRDILDATFRF